MHMVPHKERNTQNSQCLLQDRKFKRKVLSAIADKDYSLTGIIILCFSFDVEAYKLNLVLRLQLFVVYDRKKYIITPILIVH